MKTLLLTQRRSGSTIYCVDYNKFMQSKYPDPARYDTQPVIEPFNFKAYGSNYSEILKEIRVKESLKINKDNVNLIGEKYIKHIFKNKNYFIIKYLTYRGSVIIDVENMVKLCQKNCVAVHFLYRKNLLDLVTSKLIAQATKIWNVEKIPKNYSPVVKVDQNIAKKQIDFCVLETVNMLTAYEKFNNVGLIDKVLTYEDHICAKNYPFAGYSKIVKLNNSDSKNKFLEVNNWVPEYFNQVLDRNNLPAILDIEHYSK